MLQHSPVSPYRVVPTKTLVTETVATLPTQKSQIPPADECAIYVNRRRQEQADQNEAEAERLWLEFKNIYQRIVMEILEHVSVEMRKEYLCFEKKIDWLNGFRINESSCKAINERVRLELERSRWVVASSRFGHTAFFDGNYAFYATVEPPG